MPAFDFEGREVPFSPGASIAAALTAAGERALRISAHGPRGLYCGIGVCQECLVTVDGEGGLRACMTTARAGMRVGRQPLRAVPRAPQVLPSGTRAADLPVERPPLLVVGGGPAGLTAAATAAELGARVLLLDERSEAGGQYYKQPKADDAPPAALRDDRQYTAGRRLIDRAVAAGVEILSNAVVWGGFRGPEIAVEIDGGLRLFRPQRLIVASGAFERAHPVPGWTLPGVMTTGAAQTLLRCHGVLPGRRVLMAGNGPLNLQVALELSRAGAEVVAVAELARAPGVAAAGTLWRMAAAAPRLTAAGLGIAARLRARGVPVSYDAVLAAVTASDDELRAGIVRSGGDALATYAVDAVCFNYGFAPNTELLRLLGCAHRYDAPSGQFLPQRDADCRSTVDGVFAIGDCCGLGGAPAAQSEGVIAAHAAVGDLGLAAAPRDVAAARRRLARERRFQAALWTLFRAPENPVTLAARLGTGDTPVCRCENVTSADLDAAIEAGCSSIGQLKRTTRLGMGACQGRYCVAQALSRLAARATAEPTEFALPAPRPPLRPVRLDVLAGRPPERDV